MILIQITPSYLVAVQITKKKKIGTLILIKSHRNIMVKHFKALPLIQETVRVL